MVIGRELVARQVVGSKWAISKKNERRKNQVKASS
jgi:hypothetical protein